MKGRNKKMVKKNANREGTIRQRKDGSWESRIQINGSRKSFYGKTREEVSEKLTKAKSSVIMGISIDTNRIKFKELAEEWYQSKEGTVTDGVMNTYQHSLDHIYAKIGDKLITKIRVFDIEKMYKDLLKTKTNHGDKYISASYVSKTISTVVNQVFGYAMKHEMIFRNPTIGAKKPKVVEEETPVWSEEEIKKFMSVIKRTDHQALFGILIFAFPRINEVLSLEWDDIDLEKGVMHISKTIKRNRNNQKVIGTAKTKNSIRRVRLTPYVLNALSLLKETQHREYLNGVKPHSELVFPNAEGNWQDSNNIRRIVMKNYLIEAGLNSELHVHALRHIGISLMLQRGANPVVVAQMSGHSKVSFLFDKYSHALPNSQETVVELVADLTE